MNSETVQIEPGKPALVLAPMEGVTDAPMRALMTERGGFSFCVSEYLRINEHVPPRKVFHRHAPELLQDCRTRAGVPVQIQLLGGDPEVLAGAAARACAMGSPGIDLNFGCPAPTVNRHDGGATLLKFPERIEAIVRAVREAVPRHCPVSAKMRLGWDGLDPIHENAERAAAGGASWITIHGRTRTQGYNPPAYWKPIGEVRRRLRIPVVANGDIWTLDDLKRCQDETGCEHFMLGRCALADPHLPLRAARYLGMSTTEVRDEFPATTAAWKPLLERFAQLSRELSRSPGGGETYILRRIKQWVKMSHTRRVIGWFDSLKYAQTLPEAFTLLEGTR